MGDKADIAKQLAELASLHQQGLLTAEEFQAAKARLLAPDGLAAEAAPPTAGAAQTRITKADLARRLTDLAAQRACFELTEEEFQAESARLRALLRQSTGWPQHLGNDADLVTESPSPEWLATAEEDELPDAAIDEYTASKAKLKRVQATIIAVMLAFGAFAITVVWCCGGFGSKTTVREPTVRTRPPPSAPAPPARPRPARLDLGPLAEQERTVSSLMEKGRAMNRNDLRTCGEQMRLLQPQMKRFQNSSELTIRKAAGDGVLCVSCVQDALDYCDLAEQVLAGR